MRQVWCSFRRLQHGTLAMFVRRHMLQIGVWTLWTLSVVSTAAYQWLHDLVRHQRFNVLGMVIHCTLVGIVGLITIIYIETLLD